MMNSKRRKIIITITLLFIICVLPYVVAKYMYQHAKQFGFAKQNNGRLILPPVKTKQWQVLKSTDRWQLLMLVKQCCDKKTCSKRLYEQQQIIKALGKDANRVSSIIIQPKQCSRSWQTMVNSGTITSSLIVVDHTKMQKLTQSFNAQWQSLLQKQGRLFFIIDPLGNLMMGYPQEIPAYKQLKDMQRLLKVSQIG